jgi:AcrR family transcriptional regulator
MTIDPAKSSKRPQKGRRPGTSGTRQAIRDAARARFAEDGYASATIRKIAADAGVDASLVMQFFGSKDELFAAAMSIPPEVPARINSAFDGPEHGVGERLTRAYLDSWEGAPQESEPLLAILRGAISHEEAAAQLRDFLQARLALGAASLDRDDTDDALLRVCLAASMLIGVIVGRRIVQVPALQEQDIDALIERVAPAVQLILTPNTSSAADEARDTDAGGGDRPAAT